MTYVRQFTATTCVDVSNRYHEQMVMVDATTAIAQRDIFIKQSTVMPHIHAAYQLTLLYGIH